jgi:hypothetical protein
VWQGHVTSQRAAFIREKCNCIGLDGTAFAYFYFQLVLTFVEFNFHNVVSVFVRFVTDLTLISVEADRWCPGNFAKIKSAPNDVYIRVFFHNFPRTFNMQSARDLFCLCSSTIDSGLTHSGFISMP